MRGVSCPFRSGNQHRCVGVRYQAAVQQMERPRYQSGNVVVINDFVSGGWFQDPNQLTLDLYASGNVVRWVVIRCYFRADSIGEISEGRARSVNRNLRSRVYT